MQYDLNELKQIISSSQHCQRNWNINQQIPDSHIALLVHALTQCPSKQNNAWYKVHVITNRSVIEQIHQHTHGFGLPGGQITNNPQVLANLVVVFESQNEGDRFKNIKKAWNLPDKDNSESVLMSIGIASGYLNLISHMLGYKTGFCRCFTQSKIKTTLQLENKAILIIGIGHGNSNKNRLEHHLDPSIVFPALSKETIKVNFIR